MLKLKDLSYDELCELVIREGEKKFRASQIFRRMYSGGASDFDDLRELPKEFREKLSEKCTLNAVVQIDRQRSADGTSKYLFALESGHAVESVFMKYSYGNTACVSSQSGCRMGCRFCASGINGLAGNLTAGEIVDQVIQMENDTGEKINHVVLMGTGEPFDNYGEAVKAVLILHDERGKNLSLRNITVSTCGLIERFEQFAADLPQVNLAVSLHAPDDDVRRQIMPVANKYSIRNILDACKKYTEKTHRRVTFEYALISGVNDALKQAEKLAGILRGMLCHVNLIPLNGAGLGYAGSGRRHAEAFAGVLSDKGIGVTVRRSLGTDISAACGQLLLRKDDKKTLSFSV